MTYFPMALAVAVLVAALMALARAATFTVTDPSDALTAGTLRWAITQANANSGPDEVRANLNNGETFLVQPPTSHRTAA